MRSIPAASTPSIGPGLVKLLETQQRNDDAVSWPQLEGYARGLVTLHKEAGGDAVVWPVDAPAERLAGAGALIGGPTFRVRGMGQQLEGEHVLLVAVALVTPLPLIWAARQARALGASSITACGVDIGGLQESPTEFDYVVDLHSDAVPGRRSA